MKDKGFEIVAVNARDPQSRVKQYLNDNGFSFKVVLGGEGESYTIGKTYGVMAYPTNYLVGADGKILWRGVGFSEATEKTLRAELAKLGIQ